MQERQMRQQRFVQTTLPWIIACGAIVLYLVTLNRWVSLASLPYVSEVGDWEWSLPQHAPLFFTLTYPFRWLPEGMQPILLNVFAAICSALTLGILARSVAILPHDRTHEQRLRERSEFSLLSIQASWVPPLFAALVCGLELTFWEHSISATNESLNLLLFAFVVWALLEFRITQKERWLTASALVYGLAMPNNWAMAGFLPAYLVALIWIRGMAFFNLGFLVRMLLFALAGLSLYLLLPLIAVLNESEAGFWATLRAQLGTQKAVLLHIPGLRNRALLLSLTSLLPLLIIGIRWPATSGDTSAFGTFLTRLMFRVIHLVLLGACLWVAFNQRFSPRSLGMGIPFLTFYYLGALAIGYFTGYALLVFSELKAKAWQRTSTFEKVLNRIVQGAVWLALFAVPVALLYVNYPTIRASSGDLLQRFAATVAEALPEEGAYVLSDDPYGLLLLQGYFKGKEHKHVFMNTQSLLSPVYHRKLEERYPGRWQSPAAPGSLSPVPQVVLQRIFVSLSKSNSLFYLHPSFGYYFEYFYEVPRGLVRQLSLYDENMIFPPKLTEPVIEENQQFWNDQQHAVLEAEQMADLGTRDGAFVAKYFSRALNDWGVHLQRSGNVEAASEHFANAVNVNSNNIPARVNLAFHKELADENSTPSSRSREIGDFEQAIGSYRSWNNLLLDNGPFDQPAFTFHAGTQFFQNSLFRQSAVEFQRVRELDPKHPTAPVALAHSLLRGNYSDETIRVVQAIRTRATEEGTPLTNQVELLQLEAGAYFRKSEFDTAEKILLQARSEFPENQAILDTLIQLYNAAGQWTNSLTAITKQLEGAPEDPALLLRKAEAHMNVDDFEQAIESIDRVLAKNPKHLQANLLKGILFLQRKELDTAEKHLRLVISIDPAHPDALLSLAATLLEQKNYKEAVELLDRLLANSPGSWAALKNRAIAHLELGDFEKAEQDYRVLLQLVPNFHAAYYGLAEIASRRKQHDDAIRYYELYLKHLPASASEQIAREKQQVEERLKELKAKAG